MEAEAYVELCQTQVGEIRITVGVNLDGHNGFCCNWLWRICVLYEFYPLCAFHNCSDVAIIDIDISKSCGRPRQLNGDPFPVDQVLQLLAAVQFSSA